VSPSQRIDCRRFLFPHECGAGLAKALLKDDATEVVLSEAAAPEKILVVDDDDAIRNMVERILRREKYEVDSARDGFEAIEKLSRNDYGTVLLDLMMPRVDGLGVLRWLENEKPPAAQPRVIVMTANLHGATEAAEAPSIFRIVSKPFDIRQLVSHVRDCTG
jgi:DNA-binding response OmpR family regulator